MINQKYNENVSKYNEIYNEIINTHKLEDLSVVVSKEHNPYYKSHLKEECPEKGYNGCWETMTLSKNYLSSLNMELLKLMIRCGIFLKNYNSNYEPNAVRKLSSSQITGLELIKDLIKRRNKETLNKMFEEIN